MEKQSEDAFVTGSQLEIAADQASNLIDNETSLNDESLIIEEQCENEPKVEVENEEPIAKSIENDSNIRQSVAIDENQPSDAVEQDFTQKETETNQIPIEITKDDRQLLSGVISPLDEPISPPQSAVFEEIDIKKKSRSKKANRKKRKKKKNLQSL